jgi:hypothetical protein
MLDPGTTEDALPEQPDEVLPPAHAPEEDPLTPPSLPARAR